MTTPYDVAEEAMTLARMWILLHYAEGAGHGPVTNEQT